MLDVRWCPLARLDDIPGRRHHSGAISDFQQGVAARCQKAANLRQFYAWILADRARHLWARSSISGLGNADPVRSRRLRHPLFALCRRGAVRSGRRAGGRGGSAARAQFEATAADPVKISRSGARPALQSRRCRARNPRGACRRRYRSGAKLCRARCRSRGANRSGADRSVNEATAKRKHIGHEHRRAFCPRTMDRRADRSREPRRHRGRRSVRVRRHPRRRARRHALSAPARNTIRGFSACRASASASPRRPMPRSVPRAPERVGLSVVKAASRTGRLNPALAVRVAREAVKVEECRRPRRACRKCRADREQSRHAGGARQPCRRRRAARLSRLARLSAAKGGKTRAIIKLLGRGAIVLAASALDLRLWMFWAALALIGFCSSCKAAVERMTLRHLERRKLRLARAALFAQPALLRCRCANSASVLCRGLRLDPENVPLTRSDWASFCKGRAH